MKPGISDHFDGHRFYNTLPTPMLMKGAFFRSLKKWFRRNPHLEPSRTPGPFHCNAELMAKRDPTGLQVTWLGHSTVYLMMEGITILTDPVWARMASPFVKIGPRRFFDIPIAIHDLPAPDLILLSHDHYDHLDRSAMLYFGSRDIPVITLSGVGDRLVKWGVRSSLVTQLDWWEETHFSGLRITATPARHFSGRWLHDRCKTLWGSFSIHGSSHAVYFGADSGYYPGFREIGERLGPFDLVMLETGAYNQEDWPYIHMIPEEAVRAFTELGGKILLPVHWGTFRLSFHGWKEPVERLIAEADRMEIPLILPEPGETVDIHHGPVRHPWWTCC